MSKSLPNATFGLGAFANSVARPALELTAMQQLATSPHQSALLHKQQWIQLDHPLSDFEGELTPKQIDFSDVRFS